MEPHTPDIGQSAADRQAAAAGAANNVEIERAAVGESAGDRQHRGPVEPDRAAVGEGALAGQSPLFPYTTLFRSAGEPAAAGAEHQSRLLARRAEHLKARAAGVAQ